MTGQTKSRHKDGSPSSTQNGIAVVKSLAGRTLTQLRYAEEADIDAPAAAILHVLIRAADNASRTLSMSQQEIARRTKLSEKSVWRKLLLLEKRGFILRENQPPTTYGRRSWDLLTMAELDPNGEPVSADSESSGEAVSADSESIGPPDSLSCISRLSDGVSIEANASIPSDLPSAESPNVFVERAAARENGKSAESNQQTKTGKSAESNQQTKTGKSAPPQSARRRNGSNQHTADSRSARSNLPAGRPLDSESAGTLATVRRRSAQH